MPEQTRSRKLFCQRSPLAYRLSVAKCCAVRRLRDLPHTAQFARTKSAEQLPFKAYKNASLIRRTLGKVDPVLQENKATNLALAAPHLDGVLIRPGETFSFWRLVGPCTAKRGYLPGLVIASGEVGADIGGGMCQMTNLIHWMVLHTPLTITEHHHHDGLDLFPDNGRTVPFGTGTSVFYNYVDYRVRNDTPDTYQLRIGVDGAYLRGALLCSAEPTHRWHIAAQNERFVREGAEVYRCGEVVRTCIDSRTGNELAREVIKENHARVLYDTAGLAVCEAAHEVGEEHGEKTFSQD